MKKLPSKTIALIEAGSWYGVVVTLLAYMLVSFGYLPPSHPIPVFFNITGALTMLFDAWKDKNWQPVTINVIWIAIAIITFTRAFFL